MNTLELLKCSPVMPVIVIQDVDTAVHLARALLAGNIRTLEVTLRSDVALAAIRAIRDQVPDALVGAGTVRTPQQLDAALQAGAQFVVSPGLTPELSKAALRSGIPFLPGVATASEAMQAADQGFVVQKLFPAQAVGGTALLKAWYGPLPDLVFCPTGGIDLYNMGAYLSLPNVACVGGSWLTPKQAIHDAQWQLITELASQACKIARDCKS
ncbi:MAG TPA: bifunctional 4-hydroxy-2-oxoglutarate aldolase/2-dehydro-3-deoxy-phosphogluconate aldolase [Castellaniella sp.]|nr:bifunctional 4-hydroxy-2-oxoglutarate aldolase/2-dehydro-3-deoxy-phosphogluconate aldolase [Castellaniella sp.]